MKQALGTIVKQAGRHEAQYIFWTMHITVERKSQSNPQGLKPHARQLEQQIILAGRNSEMRLE